MSISVGGLGAEGQFPTYDPYRPRSPRIRIYQLQCRCCGYDSRDEVAGPPVCPKCGSHAWERILIGGIILPNAERYPN